MQGYHSSVLLKEAIDHLKVEKDKWYLDATLGDGGHTAEIIKIGGRVFGFDVDPQAIQRAQKRLKDLGIDESRFRLVQGNFRDLENLIKPAYAKATAGKQTETEGFKFSGILFDLGVSTLQLMDPERGFSFMREGPLDMRMDPTLGVRAKDLLNILTRKELYELFSKLGEEKYSKKLADALVSAREVEKVTGYGGQGTGIKTTKDLAEFVERMVGRQPGKIPAYAKATAGKHPATRIFQALRIVVNDELNALKEALDQSIALIEKNGSIIVISFHSLEDRIVKTTFRQWESEGLGKILTKKPLTPSEEEVRINSRSRSAKMRIFKYDNYKKI